MADGAAKAKGKPAFAAKKQRPSVEDFALALEAADAKRWEATRAFLAKQAGVEEHVFYYGSQTGWGLRYLASRAPLCALLVNSGKPFAVVAVTQQASAEVDWAELSNTTQAAKLNAEGTQAPDKFWLNVALDAKGQSDIRALVRARLIADGAG